MKETEVYVWPVFIDLMIHVAGAVRTTIRVYLLDVFENNRYKSIIRKRIERVVPADSEYLYQEFSLG